MKAILLIALLSLIGFAANPSKNDIYKQLNEHCKCINIHQANADAGVKIYTIVCDNKAKDVFKFFKQSKKYP